MKILIILSLISFYTGSIKAQDNPIRASWQKVVVKVNEMHSNNRSNPLKGAKVTITLANMNAYTDGRTKFPQTMTSGIAGVTFNKMPPSSMVGNYVVTVIPKPNDKDRNNNYTCKPVKQSFAHTINTQTNRRFTINCAPIQSMRGKDCHKVKIQKLEGRKATVSAKACKQNDGSWKIDPYRYKN